MGKFMVGDKVEFIENYGKYVIGDKVTVTGREDDNLINFDGKCGTGCALERRFKLSDKTTKNQRITALESELSELRPLKEVVPMLQKRVEELGAMVEKSVEPSTDISVEDIIEFEGAKYRKVDREVRDGDVIICKDQKNKEMSLVNDGKRYLVGAHRLIKDTEINVYNEHHNRTPETVDVYELIAEEKPMQVIGEIKFPVAKSQNQQRKEIIEKAKGFVEECKTDFRGTTGKTTAFGQPVLHKGVYVLETCRNIVGKRSVCRGEFIVNEEKRTVVALMRGVNTGNVLGKGIAKCNPSDVFNEHIGKAIALGRALGLDVSEFKQAVQPTEIVNGAIYENVHIDGTISKRTMCSGNNANYINKKLEHGRCGTFNGNNFFARIINDTNAQYEEVE